MVDNYAEEKRMNHYFKANIRNIVIKNIHIIPILDLKKILFRVNKNGIHSKIINFLKLNYRETA